MDNNKSLSEKEISHNPFILFDIWYREQLDSDILIPDSVSLATASADERISVRTVLLKDYNENGFVFYTNYNSLKGSQLSSNSRVALLFYWPESGRQIRIEGRAIKLAVEESEAYFRTRPRESQLAAWASEQSSLIPDRKHLEDRYSFYNNLFLNKTVEKPPHWGGFRIIPGWFEFWQNGEYRLHDRLSYTLRNDKWLIERLAP